MNQFFLIFLFFHNRATYEQQVALAKNAFKIREEREFKSTIERVIKQLEEIRIMNVATEKTKKQEW